MERISRRELEKVLEQARDERWHELTLWGPGYWLHEGEGEGERIYWLRDSLGDEGARALASLSSLTSLDLTNNYIGDEGARVLAKLSSLTSLHLTSHKIGDEGAGALASLSSLTSLHLSFNNVGDEGAGALASLSSLTSQIGRASCRERV